MSHRLTLSSMSRHHPSHVRRAAPPAAEQDSALDRYADRAAQLAGELLLLVMHARADGVDLPPQTLDAATALTMWATKPTADPRTAPPGLAAL